DEALQVGVTGDAGDGVLLFVDKHHGAARAVGRQSQMELGQSARSGCGGVVHGSLLLRLNGPASSSVAWPAGGRSDRTVVVSLMSHWESASLVQAQPALVPYVCLSGKDGCRSVAAAAMAEEHERHQSYAQRQGRKDAERHRAVARPRYATTDVVLARDPADVEFGDRKPEQSEQHGQYQPGSPARLGHFHPARTPEPRGSLRFRGHHLTDGAGIATVNGMNFRSLLESH